MDSTSSQESMDRVVDVLGRVRKKGVRLWSENGQLRYKAPKGALTREEIEGLRLAKGQLVALLERAADVEATDPKLQLHPRSYSAPLAFSQLAHWNLYQLGNRRSLRQIASATRLRGRLNIDALRKSVGEVVRRHDALRTRIVVRDGIPRQEVSESGDCELVVDDLTTLSERLHEIEVKSRIYQLILDPIDVASGPLFGLQLISLRHDEHVLIVAMEHLIADAFSMNILLRDIFMFYIQTLKGRACLLPAMPVQFADYAVWQRNALSSWAEKHGAYWNQIAGCRRLRFPVDKDVSIKTRSGWGTVPVRIGRDLKAQLREWCRLRQTTLAMSVFTAYVGLVLRWCDVSEAMIQYQADGRVSRKIANTIGYFASVLYLHIKIPDDDSYVDLLNRVTEEYCKAYEHADFSYMAAQMPPPEFTRNTAFNWVPQAPLSDLSNLDGSEDAISCAPIAFDHPMLEMLGIDAEPEVLLFDTDDEIVGDVYFPLNRFSIDTMERFGRNFLVFIRALIRQPDGWVKEIVLSQ